MRLARKAYYYHERERQQKLLQESFFDGVPGNGIFKGKPYPFILKDGMHNLFSDIREDVVTYFSENGIEWWGGKRPTGHVLSSQMACLNHLFARRHDADAVLKIINGIRPIFKKVLPIESDKDKGFIAFEAVSNSDHLKEDASTRGANCTSVDALILGVDDEDKTWLIPIEWKYTETYGDGVSSDKSLEGYKVEKDGTILKTVSRPKGDIRMDRYNAIIDSSEQLRSVKNYRSSVYYFEPFYQLMRQTLWAEQMVKHRETEIIKADDYLHVHVIPSINTGLLHRKYAVSKEGMEKTWRSMLVNLDKYVIVDPKDFLEPIQSSYPELTAYLNTRYWSND